MYYSFQNIQHQESYSFINLLGFVPSCVDMISLLMLQVILIGELTLLFWQFSTLISTQLSKTNSLLFRGNFVSGINFPSLLIFHANFDLLFRSISLFPSASFRVKSDLYFYFLLLDETHFLVQMNSL